MCEISNEVFAKCFRCNEVECRRGKIRQLKVCAMTMATTLFIVIALVIIYFNS